MVRQERFQYQMKNVLEAKTFLIARAAKRVFQRMEEKKMDAFQDALTKEFDAEHIKYRAAMDKTTHPDAHADYLCFGNMLVRTKTSRQLTERDLWDLRKELHRQDLSVGIIVCFTGDGVDVKRLAV